MLIIRQENAEQPLSKQEERSQQSFEQNLLENDEQIHSEEMQEVISAPPKWLLKWGILIFFMILAFILFTTAFIRYPDVVKATLRINYINPPRFITVKLNGTLLQLFVKDHQQVSKNQVIALLESDGNFKEILGLELSLRQMQRDIISNKPIVFPVIKTFESGWWGELETDVQNFYFYYQITQSSPHTKGKIDRLSLLGNIRKLLAQIDRWKATYLLIAPQAGRIIFTAITQRNQYVTAGREIFYIEPKDKTSFGELTIGQSDLRKIKIGQSVNIKLKMYPFEQYGLLQGTISVIDDVPSKGSMFSAHVKIDRKKSSAFLRSVQLKPGMVAEADIITEESSLFKRLTKRFLKL